MKSFVQKIYHNNTGNSQFIFAAISCFILLSVYNGIMASYGFLDDYYLFYTAGEKSTFDIFNSMGRPIKGLMINWLFSNLYYISDLKYARIVSLVGIILFCVLLYREYLLADWSKVNAGCAALISCLMPPFGIYAAWATCFPVIYGIGIAFMAGKASFTAFDIFDANASKLKAILIILLSICLINISLMIYQPAVAGFWLYIAIVIFRPSKNNDIHIKKVIFSFSLHAVSVLIYYCWYTTSIWPFKEDIYTRSPLTTSPISKLLFFIKDPIYNGLSLFNILQDESITLITVIFVSCLIFIGLTLRIVKKNMNKFHHAILLSGLLPLSYYPNLLSKVNAVAFRTHGILSSVIVLYFLIALKEIFSGKLIKFLFPLILLVFCLMAHNNVTYGFIEVQKKEIELIRGALKEVISVNSKEIDFIRPNMKDFISKGWKRHEYGIESSFYKWVPESLVNLIARESLPDVKLPIRVNDTTDKLYIPSREDRAVINVGELLVEYEKSLYNKKFDFSKDRHFLIQSAEGLNELKSHHQISFLIDEDNLIVRSLGNDPHFELPEIQSHRCNLLMKIVISSPEDTMMQLFYKTKSLKRYSEKQSIKKFLKKGQNVVFILLPQKMYKGSFRLDPGKIAGDFILHSIEIRGI